MIKSESNQVVFVDEKLQCEFYELLKGTIAEKELFESIKKAINSLIDNPLSGVQIQRKKWPKEYISKYGINNLWKYNLPNGWRLIYTITSEKIEIISIILEWFNHKEYERKFGY